LAVGESLENDALDKPDVPAIEAWFERLNQRPAFLRHGNNGMI
jgi:glutathione S-transferase